MRRLPLALLAVLVVALLLPRTFGVLKSPRHHPPSDLRDALGRPWADLATLHERVGLPGDRCAWCHLDMAPRAARGLADDPARWVASAGPAAAPTVAVNSTVCLSCHDGATARAASDSSAVSRDPDLMGGSNHPIGADYMASYLRAPGEYKHPGSSDVRLEDGKVGCTSCHVGHERNGRLGGPAAAAYGGCLACHNR